MTTQKFISADFSATLFPLQTNKLLAEVHAKEISDYIYQKVLGKDNEGNSFLSQQKVFATKPKVIPGTVYLLKVFDLVTAPAFLSLEVVNFWIKKYVVVIRYTAPGIPPDTPDIAPIMWALGKKL